MLVRGEKFLQTWNICKEAFVRVFELSFLLGGAVLVKMFGGWDFFPLSFIVVIEMYIACGLDKRSNKVVVRGQYAATRYEVVGATQEPWR